MLARHLQGLPLLAEVNPHVLPGHCEVGTGGVEAEILHFITVNQLESFGTLQFPEIPEFDGGILPSSGKIVT